MIAKILEKYTCRGSFPYDNWASDAESFFLLQKVWLDIIEKYSIFVEYLADQEVIQQDGSYIVSLRNESKRVLIYPLSSNSDYGFDFYLKHPLDRSGSQDTKLSMLVLDCKLSLPYLEAAVGLLKKFDDSTVGSTDRQDALYHHLHSSYNYLLAYHADGSLRVK